MRFHRPSLPGAELFEQIEDGGDPALLSEAAERSARALVRGGHESSDPALVDRVVHLAETEGLDSLASLWAHAPADSLAGAVWRLYLLRAWVHADPAGAAREFELGRRLAPVSEVISGVKEPPGPDEVRTMIDSVLSGVVVGDFADTLFRAAAFARVAATGRAEDDRGHGANLSGARLLTLAGQLEQAARLELDGRLG
ncbi:MAG TPA: hypothetical protein VF426_06445 [Marmoricola sp.]